MTCPLSTIPPVMAIVIQYYGIMEKSAFLEEERAATVIARGSELDPLQSKIQALSLHIIALQIKIPPSIQTQSPHWRLPASPPVVELDVSTHAGFIAGYSALKTAYNAYEFDTLIALRAFPASTLIALRGENNPDFEQLLNQVHTRKLSEMATLNVELESEETCPARFCFESGCMVQRVLLFSPLPQKPWFTQKMTSIPAHSFAGCSENGVFSYHNKFNEKSRIKLATQKWANQVNQLPLKKAPQGAHVIAQPPDETKTLTLT